MKITITEGLAEIKTIAQRIEKKEEAIYQNLTRSEDMRDPFEKDGENSKLWIERQLQSVSDLEVRLIAVRQAIANVNAVTRLSVCNTTRTVSEWLVWKREVAPGLSERFDRISQNIAEAKLRKNVSRPFAQAQDVKPSALVVNIDESDLARKRDELEQLTGTLDGALSLINATTFIEFADY
jgi:hypothetical protein